jgi:aminoglycoside phosphotransferase (APT) family kinase protein
MAFVPGRVPADDRPSFAEAGFLHDAAPADQRAFHTGLLDAIARVHETDPAAVATDGDERGSSLDAALDDLRAIWRFDRGERWSDIVEHAIAALADSVPAPRENVLLWGDARPANVIVPDDGFHPIALLDWELAGIGPPELELTWLAEMNRMRMQGSGVAPLPGFLTDDEAVRYYEARTGRTLQHLAWFTLYSATRVAVLMHRHLRVMVHVGRLPGDHRLLTRTIAIDRVAGLLGGDSTREARS